MSKNIIHVEGYDAFKEAANINKEKTVFAFFTGSIEENGSSWCPDCVAGRWSRRFVSWAFRSQPSSSFYLETVKHIFRSGLKAPAVVVVVVVVVKVSSLYRLSNSWS